MRQKHEEGSNCAQQQPRNARSRRAAKRRLWYGRRALDCLHLWMQPAVVPPPPPPAAEEEGSPSWRCCSSAKAAALAFARLLRLCAPTCSHEVVLLLGVHVDAAAPTTRRGSSCSACGVSPAAAVPAPTRPSAAPAWEGTARSRAPCRGRSLTYGAPTRRFVLDELARRRDEMEAVHVKIRRSRDEWQPPGNSRLRRMSLAEDEDG